MAEGPDVPGTLAGLASRVRDLERTPELPPPVVDTDMSFFRMDNPWMWILVVAVIGGIVALWAYLRMKKKNDEMNSMSSAEGYSSSQGFPHQTTPARQYMAHYGLVE